jgi:hypothetical protein
LEGIPLISHYHWAEQPAFLTFTAIHPDKLRLRPSCHIPVGHPRALRLTVDRLMQANQQGWGAYFGVATRRPGLRRWQRGGKRDLLSLPAVFVDLDQPDPGILAKMELFDLPPSCVISSSENSYHVYWFIQPTSELAEADRVLRGLAQHFGGDVSMTSDQSLRLVGGQNTKRNRNNWRCQIVSLHPDRKYTLGAFRSVLPSLPAPTPHIHVRLPSSEVYLTADKFRTARQAVESALYRDFGGYLKPNGFVAALCPYGHTRDYPGNHFSWNSRSGVGYCFGRHATVNLLDLADRLGVILN